MDVGLLTSDKSSVYEAQVLYNNIEVGLVYWFTDIKFPVGSFSLTWAV